MKRLRVVIAGGGVAGLEATLALAELAPELVDVELLSPDREFVYRPMLVAEPFGTARALRFDLAEVVADAGAKHRKDTLAAVDLEAHAVSTGAGERIEYGALLVALGARPVEAIPGAITFEPGTAGGELDRLLRVLGSRHARRIAFVVPPGPTWTIAAYELAMMTAAERDARRIAELELTVVTPEPAPLAAFGVAASELVAATLERAGVELRTDAVVEAFEEPHLRLSGGGELEAHEVVALPGLEGPGLDGLPQRSGGFVTTDVAMHVGGLDDVWAAGDMTWFPIKQGGLAAQQANVAARGIARRAGARVVAEPFRPTLRGALITGEAPEFLEAEIADPAHGRASAGRPLWTPSIKLAAPHLGPYIARKMRGGQSVPRFADLGGAAADDDYAAAVALVLSAADQEAERGDPASALKWLSLAEQLELALPAAYVARREAWRRELDPASRPHPAAGRIDPSFASPDEAISDMRRRVGWLRESEARNEREMEERLEQAELGLDQLISRSREILERI